MADTREKLVRAHFDAYSDLLWATDLEPKFRQYDLSAGELKAYRQAWKRHTEAKDWNWWQENTKGMADAELREDIAECKAEIAASHKERAGRQEGSVNACYDKMLAEASQKAPVTKDKGIDR